MSKKILISLLSVAVIAAGVVAVSAFEAHIINVTAHIENALSVLPKEIKFGTVFPQEYLEEKLTIELSDSFKAADRVDDVEYKIVQKLKPCPLKPNTTEPVDPTCVPDTTGETPHNPTGWHYLSLCEFLSKTPEVEKGDSGVLSYFHEDLAGNFCQEPFSHLSLGRLSKLDKDFSDEWTIDLKVPPVKGTVGQDWPASCADWVVESNDKTYGCDLWVEVTGISLPGPTPEPTPPPNICSGQADVMLVLDRSSSIDAGELATLKTASLAFVTALAPTTDGVHMGQSSFSDNGSLDLHLTEDQTTINAAINALTTSGFTNMKEGINLANGELANTNAPPERPLVPDIMVVVTDGHPNRPIPSTAAAQAAAEADAARAAGVEIYAVGVGSNVDANYLSTEIADDANHYFGAADFDDLEAILEAIAHCNQT